MSANEITESDREAHYPGFRVFMSQCLPWHCQLGQQTERLGPWKNHRSSRYSGYRFRCILVSYETIQLWWQKFGADYVRKLKRRQGRLGDHWHLDEVFLRINGQLQYLWRAIDQGGDVIDILVEPRRDRGNRLLRAQMFLVLPS